jgi:hypothetical protein
MPAEGFQCPGDKPACVLGVEPAIAFPLRDQRASAVSKDVALRQDAFGLRAQRSVLNQLKAQ